MSLGVFWSFLNPLVLVGIYTFVFTKIFPNQAIAHFPLFILIGVVCFNYFNLSWITGTASITSNSSLVKRVRVPREVIPISTVLANGIHFLMQFGLILVFTLASGLSVGLSWLCLPPVILLLVLAVSGLSLLTSALDVYFRDTRYIVESFGVVLFWLTPVFYSEKMIPAQYRTFYFLNPVAGVAIAIRQIILEQRVPDFAPLFYSALSTGAILIAGISLFHELKKRFADHL
jgi:lipopolysaccharide transport system permease protein